MELIPFSCFFFYVYSKNLDLHPELDLEETSYVVPEQWIVPVKVGFQGAVR